MFRRALSMAIAATALAACNTSDTPSSTEPTSAPAFDRSGGASVGVVFTETNATSGNDIAVFARSVNGALTPAGSYAAGGTGTGAGLGSQGAVTLTDNGRLLLAVNAGSNSVSIFSVDGTSLTLINTVPSGGTRPISVTVDKKLAYVVNAGGAGNIAGFRLDRSNGLSSIAGSSRPLSANAPAPAQISFSPKGDQLIVSEKGTNRLVTYSVGNDGLASGPQITPSAGQTPFGFAFAHNDVLIVTEAFGGAPDASAASSYRLGKGGAATLSIVSATVPTTETAACWAAATPNGRWVYVTNTGSSTVTGYEVSPDGRLSILNGDGRTAYTGAGSSPLDEAITQEGRFLYVLTRGTNNVVGFAIQNDGSLESLGAGTSLPAGSIGLAAR